MSFGQGPATVRPEVLRRLWGGRVALAADVGLDESTDTPGNTRLTLLVPRRGRLERALARLMHGPDTRLRLEVPAQGREVIARLASDRGLRPVRDLAHDLGGLRASGDGPDVTHPPTVAFLVFLEQLARSRVLDLDVPEDGR